MEVLLALSVLKGPLGIKLFLNIIPVFVGLFYIFKKRIFSFFVAPMILMVILNLVLNVFHSDWGSILRLGQLICMIGFCHFVSEWIDEEKLLKICKYIVIISCVVLILEIIFKGSVSPKKIAFNLYLPRFEGPVGESNYTGIILAICSIIFLFFRKWAMAVLSFILIVLCVSRTSAIMVLFFIFFNLLFTKRKGDLKYIAWAMLVVMLASPLILGLIEKFADYSIKAALEKASAGRYYLQIAYIDMGIKNILGVGYFNGWNDLMPYLTPYLPIIDSIRNHQNNEQHSIFIQVFSEFGVIGYLFFVWQVLNICKRVFNNNPNWFFLIVVVFWGYCFLNGLSDFILYLAIGTALSKNFLLKEKKDAV